jgi:hypothetical protein
MSRYYHEVDAEQVDISEAGVLPLGMLWMSGRWVYVTPHGMLWPRSGDWIVTDQNGRAAVLRDEEFQRGYVPCPTDAAGCPERWTVTDAPVGAPRLTAGRTGAPREAHAASLTEPATRPQRQRHAWYPVLRGLRSDAAPTPPSRHNEEVATVATEGTRDALGAQRRAS